MTTPVLFLAFANDDSVHLQLLKTESAEIWRRLADIDRQEFVKVHREESASVDELLTGRQPFTVYGLLRTTESASPLAAPAVASSLIAFIIVYFTVFTAGVIYLLRLMAAPPHPGEPGPSKDVPARAAGITPAAGAAAEGAAR